MIHFFHFAKRNLRFGLQDDILAQFGGKHADMAKERETGIGVAHTTGIGNVAWAPENR